MATVNILQQFYSRANSCSEGFGKGALYKHLTQSLLRLFFSSVIMFLTQKEER